MLLCRERFILKYAKYWKIVIGIAGSTFTVNGYLDEIKTKGGVETVTRITLKFSAQWKVE